MALEDRIRSSVDSALGELTARLDKDVRAIVQQLVTVALEERAEVLDQMAVAEARLQTALAEADARAEVRLKESVVDAQVQEREAEMAALTRLLESVRGLDGATTLSEVLDALGQAIGREAARAAVFVLKKERLVGWKLTGFGARDAQPKSLDLGLDESGVIGQAVGTARPATTRDRQATAAGPDFAQLPADRLGFAVPVIVGGRVVAVVYADSVTSEGHAHVVPNGWPEVVEILSRHAARCLEALSVQKAAGAASPRFWVPGPVRAAPTTGETTTRAASDAAPASGSDAPRDVTT